MCKKLKMMKKQRANSGPGGNIIPDGNDTCLSPMGGGGNVVVSRFKYLVCSILFQRKDRDKTICSFA